MLGCRLGTRRQTCVCAHPDVLFALATAPPWTLAFREVVGSHGPARSPTQELLEAVHLHLVKEYIARLCKRRLVLQTAEQQQQLAGHVQANAQLIQQFCTQSVSPRPPPQPPTAVGCPPAPSSSRARTASLGLSKPDQVRPEPLWAPGRASGQGQPLSTSLCLQGSRATWLHDALPTLVEIIRLQDPSAIKIEVATYATLYPDFR